MGRDLSFEHPQFSFFATIRTVASRLWLVNNPALEERVLAYLARYAERYSVTLYGFIMMGNHYHLLAKFPNGNKAAFFRDFNGMISKLAKSQIDSFEGGKLWARRVRTQVLPNSGDILDRVLYTALNPVAAGLVERISDYPAYNSFLDAIHGRTREFEVVEWQDYNNRRRKNSRITIRDCTKTHTLSYSRIPGCEAMDQRDYIDFMEQQLNRRRLAIVERRKQEGVGFIPLNSLRKQVPGARPKVSKRSNRDSHRPLVLTLCRETRRRFHVWYFDLVAKFRSASEKFRAGVHSVKFPAGTYRPWSLCSCRAI